MMDLCEHESRILTLIFISVFIACVFVGFMAHPLNLTERRIPNLNEVKE